MVELGGNLVISGDCKASRRHRTYDLALRMAYSYEDNTRTNFNLIVIEDLRRAIDTALEHTPATETLHIIPTYSAMLEVREILVGRKIL